MLIPDPAFLRGLVEEYDALRALETAHRLLGAAVPDRAGTAD
ncbi:hypothetical protein [Streptomyces griseorubiginosus]